MGRPNAQVTRRRQHPKVEYMQPEPLQWAKDMEAAARDYGVAITYLGTDDQIVRMPKDYAVDEAETARLRQQA